MSYEFNIVVTNDTDKGVEAFIDGADVISGHGRDEIEALEKLIARIKDTQSKNGWNPAEIDEFQVESEYEAPKKHIPKFQPEDCPFAMFQKETGLYHLTGDPADAGGIICTKKPTKEGCTPEWDECPRMMRTKENCPKCLRNGRIVRLREAEIIGNYWCPECGHIYPINPMKNKEGACCQK